MNDRPTKLRAKGSDLVTEVLRRHLDKGAGASIVVPGAEGWRHCSSNADVTAKQIKEQSRALRSTSLERIEAGTFSPGEAAFFESELADEL